MLKRIAIIRKDNIRECPFGLPIVTGCLHAGDAVDRMQALDEVPEHKHNSVKKANRRIYRHYKTGERCPFADKIATKHRAVHCDRGEGGERLRDFPMRPSPFYPRVFSGLGQTGLFAYPVDYYWDNPSARSLFTGIYSIYASTGEINITKDSILPDPVLKSLVASSPTAVIIQGNPKYITDNPDAERFYNEIKGFLEQKGFSVSMDPGEPETSPPDADLWIGHSRGVDRLQFAEGDTLTLGLGAPNYPGVINHPKDEPQVGKEPNEYHYILTEEMLDAISQAADAILVREI